METPLQWHRRQAIVLASQLPDSSADALMVVQALQELVETFLAANDVSLEEPRRLAANVLPFTG